MEHHSDNTPLPFVRPAAEGNRREANRVVIEDLTCDRGEILDLSQTGARLATRWPWREGKTRPITIAGAKYVVTLRARCVWTMKDGLLRYTVGVYFEQPTDEQLDKLSHLARAYAARDIGAGYGDAA